MTDDRLHQVLMAADPLPADAAGRLPVDEAQHELLAGLLATPRPARRPARRRTTRKHLVPRVGLAVGVLAAAMVSVLSLSSRSDHGSGTAWAAEQVRFAEASPLVLLGAPGWRVTYADEQSQREGELHFRFGRTAGGAQLNWRGGSFREWVKGRAHDAAVATTARVLGTTARVFQYQGGTPGHRDITSVFRYDGRVLEFRAGAADIAAFKALLATLKRVDTDAWLSAMPASVVKTADHSTVVAQMLQGITVPPGFSAGDIKGADLTKDRYQLGAAVTGTVACQWFKLWAEARAAHDPVQERQAVAAMATAKHWPILKEMAKQGAYPEVLLGYARAMPSGRWYGRPILGDVKEGLGCDVYGVDLG